ncbi:MAG: hypothetical protein AB1Z65_04290 [Candidatus Sulfomarinibacteraceae bacterium]
MATGPAVVNPELGGEGGRWPTHPTPGRAGRLGPVPELGDARKGQRQLRR